MQDWNIVEWIVRSERTVIQSPNAHIVLNILKTHTWAPAVGEAEFFKTDTTPVKLSEKVGSFEDQVEDARICSSGGGINFTDVYVVLVAYITNVVELVVYVVAIV